MNSSPAEFLMSQWFLRVWNEADVSAIAELATPDMQSHGLVQTIIGADSWRREFYEPMRASFYRIKVNTTLT